MRHTFVQLIALAQGKNGQVIFPGQQQQCIFLEHIGNSFRDIVKQKTAENRKSLRGYFLNQVSFPYFKSPLPYRICNFQSSLPTFQVVLTFLKFNEFMARD